MSPIPTRMPPYNPEGRRHFKPLRDRSDAMPRVGKIMDIEADVLLHEVGGILSSGCAILLSPTSDGGAVSITVYHGDERSRDYVASAEEFASSLGLARDIAEAHALNGSTPPINIGVRPSQSVKE